MNELTIELLFYQKISSDLLHQVFYNRMLMKQKDAYY